MALSEKYTQAQADRINRHFKELKAPFQADCNRNEELTFYRIMEGCNGIRTSKASEQSVAKWLEKNTDKTFKQIVRREAVKSAKRKTASFIKQSIECPPCPECPEPDLNFDVIEIIEGKVKTKKINDNCGIKSVKNMRLGSCTKISTSNEKLEGRYGIIELDKLIVSHNPETFSINPNYPKGCQEREYHSNEQLQGNVNLRAKSLDPNFLINNAPTAEDGPPIVSTEGVVLGGNSRAMMLVRAKKHHPAKWQEYQEQLEENIGTYGINTDIVRDAKAPVLVRVVDVDMNKCSHYSRILNTSLKNETDDTALAVSLAKYLTDKDLQRIGKAIEDDEAESMSQVFSSVQTRTEIKKILTEKGVINDTNRTKFLAGQTFSDAGKLLVEKILLAAILEKKQYIESSKTYANKLLKNIPFFIKVKTYTGGWNFTPSLHKAIEQEGIRSDSKMNKNTYLSQLAMFPDKNPMTERDKLVWDLLDLTQNKFKTALIEYDKMAQTMMNNADSAFPVKEVTPVKALDIFVHGKPKPSLADGSKPKMRSQKVNANKNSKSFLGKVKAWVKKDLAYFTKK